MDPAELDTASHVFDFVELFLRDRREGRQRTLQDYLARFPGYEDDVAAEHVRLLAAESASMFPESADIEPPTPPEIPGFTIERELGRGGQGTVYLARETALGRDVALKIIRTPAGVLSSARRARLRREVEIVARLDHPGLCAVHRADLHADPPWVAMRAVEGETLAELVKRARRAQQGHHPAADSATESSTPASTSIAGGGPGSTVAADTPGGVVCGPGDPVGVRRLLAVFERAARALHAAHEAGVIHRDVKPANLMVDQRGEPVILDFGLARPTEDGTPTLTRSGEAFGTPAYMSPEQILGDGRELDARTDVYSLAVTLYECLTLQRPFSGSGNRLEQAICNEEPVSPARLSPAAPADLVVVLAVAMDKDRQRRYGNALELAEDLRRVRLYEPITARRSGPLVHLRRWVQRNPALAMSGLLLVVVLGIGLGVTLALLADVRTESDEKEQALSRARGQAIANLAMIVAEDNPTAALTMALEAASLSPGFESNNALLAALQRSRLEHRIKVRGSPGRGMDLSLFGERMLVCRNGLNLYDLASGESVFSLEFSGARKADLDPTGSWIVTGDESGVVRLHRASTGDVAFEYEAHEDSVRDVAFAPDGEHFATAGNDGTARLWTSGGDGLGLLLSDHLGAVSDVLFDETGDLLVTISGTPGSDDAPATAGAGLWSVPEGTLLASFGGHADLITTAAFAPDGTRLATASRDGTVAMHDLSDGTTRFVLEHTGIVHSVTFDPTGTRIVTTCDPGDITTPHPSPSSVWDAHTGERLIELPDQGSRAVYCADYSPDGSRLATGSYDRVVRIHDAVTGELVEVLRGSSGMIFGVHWTGDGTRLISQGGDSWADVWYLPDRPGLLELRGHTGPVRDVAFAPDGRSVLTASSDGTARLWNTADGSPRATLDHQSRVVAGVYVDGGASVTTASADGAVRLWDTSTGAPRPPARSHDAEVTVLSASPDGRWLLSGDLAGGLLLRDASTGAVRRELTGHGADIACVAWTPDSRLVVTGASDRSIRVWDTASGDARHVLERWAETAVSHAQHTIYDVDVSADGQVLVAVSQDTKIRWWNLDDGSLLAEQPTTTLGTVRFTGRGREVLVTARWNPTVLLQDPASNNIYNSAGHHSDRTTTLDRQPGGDLYVTASYDGSALIWEPRDKRFIVRLTGHEGPVHRARFSPDGRFVVTAGQDGTARVWPVDLVSVARERAAIDELPDWVDAYGR